MNRHRSRLKDALCHGAGEGVTVVFHAAPRGRRFPNNDERERYAGRPADVSGRRPDSGGEKTNRPAHPDGLSVRHQPSEGSHRSAR